MGLVRYTIDSKNVTHETIDGEVVAICLRSGYYYSITGTGGKVWDLLVLGLSVEQIIKELQILYAVDAQVALEDLSRFLADLEREGLITQEEASTEPRHLFPTGEEQLPYASPSFERFDDMQEMLILDPIHDVSEAGWPFKKEPA